MSAGEVTDAAARARVRLERSCAALPTALRAIARDPVVPASFDPLRARRILSTGVGSSAGHARFFAHVLSEQLGLPAKFVTTGALEKVPPSGALGDALVVFSQGLSPNARLAFSHSASFGSVVVVTAQGSSSTTGEREEWYEALRAAGVTLLGFDAPDEFGSLVRITGPMLGYAAALQLADSLARQVHQRVPCDFEAAAERLEQAEASLDLVFAKHEIDEPRLLSWVEGDVAFVAAEGYGELVQNLTTKWMETTLRSSPPIWDAAEFAHGGFQRMWAAGSSTLVHLSRGRASDAELAGRLAASFDSGRHRVVELRAEDLGATSVFEHEALLNALLLRWLRASGTDLSSWPGKGHDASLYDRSPELEHTALASSQRALASTPRLSIATWPEMDTYLNTDGAGSKVAVLGLGSVEQHGPHLGFGTDAWIADWLVGRVASRIEGALALPVVPFGCASEHLAFPGTLSLEPQTFIALVRDLLTSVEAHGFDSAFVFSAHGGNLNALREVSEQFTSTGCRVVVYADHSSLGERLAACGRGFGIEPAEQGHHAGELETSILAALHPEGVRSSQIAAGLRSEEGDAQHLFYPSLRDNSPSGVVGDPRRASAVRADAYLEVWADELLRFYRDQEPARSDALRK